MQSRKEALTTLFPKEPRFRLEQLKRGLFDEQATSWNDLTSLPKGMREILAKELPWLSIEEVQIFESASGDTYKAILKTQDGLEFESVLMANRKEQWTICVSSQVGCAMKCTFCATGTMGLKRSLSSDEITDQYRFWKGFLKSRPTLNQRISNVVFMGMGEPLANYDALKETISAWLEYTDLGPTKITVSTVGIINQLNKLVDDEDWPDVRIAISLHSADPKRRKEIVPTTVDHFHERLREWAKAYEAKLGSRNHWVTFEYTLLNEVNDTEEHARQLANYINKTGDHKVNVIPYNPVKGKDFSRSQERRIEAFKNILKSKGVTVTQRKIMGDDIDAACGQLVKLGQRTRPAG